MIVKNAKKKNHQNNNKFTTQSCVQMFAFPLVTFSVRYSLATMFYEDEQKVCRQASYSTYSTHQRLSHTLIHRNTPPLPL